MSESKGTCPRCQKMKRQVKQLERECSDVTCALIQANYGLVGGEVDRGTELLLESKLLRHFTKKITRLQDELKTLRKAVAAMRKEPE